MAFAGVYLLALAAGAASNVPGGIGVFEFVLLLLLPAVPQDRLLGALVAYRAIYYFAPFAIALVLLGAHELWVHRAPAVRLVRLLRTFLSAVTPQTIAIAVFLAGAVLLFSGATPGLGQSPGAAARLRAPVRARVVASARQRCRRGTC